MNVLEQRQAAADPQTKSPDLGCESTCRLLSSTTTIAIYYYYSARKLLILIYRPTRVEGWVDLGAAGRLRTMTIGNKFCCQDPPYERIRGSTRMRYINLLLLTYLLTYYDRYFHTRRPTLLTVPGLKLLLICNPLAFRFPCTKLHNLHSEPKRYKRCKFIVYTYGITI